MKRFRGARGGFFLLLAIICVLMAYYLLQLKIEKSKPEQIEMTAVQNVLSRDLERNYPQTPKEVIKYYCEITKCFYNEEYTDEELVKLAMKAKEIYDDELVANKDDESYLMDLRSEISYFKEKKYVISSYATSSSTDVDYFKEDGCDFARLYCTLFIRSGTMIQPSEEVFVLRMDEKGHWRIYGWDLVKKEE